MFKKSINSSLSFPFYPLLCLDYYTVQKISYMYKSMGAKHSNWQLSQNNQYVSYALLSLGVYIGLSREA